MNTKIEFLYLNEQDTLDAGVGDENTCVRVSEEVFGLLSQGDYLMGSRTHNSHGMGIIFPETSPFPNMPTAGPDRRFFSMMAYLGGRFDVCGNKWYGSNAENAKKGLPRSILTMMLNDKDTGAPLCLMSANLLSAARTGAIPGVAVKQLARKNAKVVAVLGCGPINQSCFRHIMSQLPTAEKVYFFDLFEEKARQVAEEAAEKYGVETAWATDLSTALREADVVSIAASRLKPLILDHDDLKPGVTIIMTGPANSSEDYWTKSKIFLDHVPLHHSYVAEAIECGNKQEYYNSVIGGPLYSLIDAGKLPPLDEFHTIGEVINGTKPGRESDTDNIVFITCGMAVFDVGLAYQLYQTAQEKGLGQSLKLWDQPAL